MNSKLEYGTGTEIPVYRGEFEIIHPGCAFVGTAQIFNHKLKLEILNRPPVGSYHWIRFLEEDPLSEQEIQRILKPKFRSGIIKKARVWCNGATVFETLIQDIVLNGLQPIIKSPFGEIEEYVAFSENEQTRVLSPPSEGMSGKELLLEIEENLKNEAKEAELTSYRRLTRKETYKAYMEPKGTSEQWIDPKEEKILEMALLEGYFEVPKRITVDELADLLGMSSTTLNNKLRSINRRVLDRLLRKWKV